MTKLRMLLGLGTLSLLAVVSCSKDEEKNGDDTGTGGKGNAVDLDSGTGGAGADTDSGAGGKCDLSTVQVVGKCQEGTAASATLRTANMLISLDKSGSMKPTTGLDKWTPMKAAIQTALAKVPVINFGLDLFPAQSVSAACKNTPTNNECCVTPEIADPVNVDVGSGSVTVPLISQELEATTPGGGTPTYEALDRALYYFTAGRGAGLLGDKYVLLATDGGPNCRSDLTADCTAETCTYNLDNQCSSGNCCAGTLGRAGCLDAERVVGKIGELQAANVSTFVVGLPGTDVYGSYLNQFATAGGKALTGTTQYYQVTDVSSLEKTFEDITVNLVTDCNVVAQNPPPSNEVLVLIDCHPVPQGDLVIDLNSKVIQIVGDSCVNLQRTGARRIDYVFGCMSVA